MMGPRENPSMKQQIIDAVQKAGTLRTAQIAELIGKPHNNVSAYVSQLLRNGALIGCEVISDRGASTWEVRIAAGAGMAERHPWTPLRAPRGGAVHATRIDDSPPARAAAAPKQARHEAPAPAAAAVVPAASAPRPAAPAVREHQPIVAAPAVAGAISAKFGLFSDGTLEIALTVGGRELPRAVLDRAALARLQQLLQAADALINCPEAA